MKMSRTLNGAIAGIVATVAMTATMRRLHPLLSFKSRYPLPPREITQAWFGFRSENDLRGLTTFLHLGFGAAAGALLGTLCRRPQVLAGALYGAGVWATSYLGWIPAVGLLKPATRHPVDRNALMMSAHLVWGAVAVIVLHELARAEQSVFAQADSNPSIPDQD